MPERELIELGPAKPLFVRPTRKHLQLVRASPRGLVVVARELSNTTSPANEQAENVAPRTFSQIGRHDGYADRPP